MDPMTSIEALVFNFGDFHFQGKPYVLTSIPYIFSAKDMQPHYDANAICEEDELDDQGCRPVYRIMWEIKDEHVLEFCEARANRDHVKAEQLAMEYGISDENPQFDRSNPYNITGTDYKYFMEGFTQRYEWE